MRIVCTERFKKAWRNLNQEQKVSVRKTIENLTVNIRHPALRAKKIKGAENIWEARASLSLRITFQIEHDTIILRNVGQRDRTLECP